MTLFSKDFFRSLAIGFIAGSIGMGAIILSPQANAMPAAPVGAVGAAR